MKINQEKGSKGGLPISQISGPNYFQNDWILSEMYSPKQLDLIHCANHLRVLHPCPPESMSMQPETANSTPRAHPDGPDPSFLCFK